MNQHIDPPPVPSCQTKDDKDLPAVAASSVHPRQLGRYQVDKLLGEGGFGRVYLAHDDQLNRSVAIKVPRWDRISAPEDAEAYIAEARVLASSRNGSRAAILQQKSRRRRPQSARQ
jgi:serine/threonine protein kinase